METYDVIQVIVAAILSVLGAFFGAKKGITKK